MTILDEVRGSLVDAFAITDMKVQCKVTPCEETDEDFYFASPEPSPAEHAGHSHQAQVAMHTAPAHTLIVDFKPAAAKTSVEIPVTLSCVMLEILLLNIGNHGDPLWIPNTASVKLSMFLS